MKLPSHHATAIVGLALLLTLPAIVQQPLTHDSFWVNWVWSDQFTSELRQGNPYPRWLPQSHIGLGSPVFYYYPPLAFYVTGLFGLLGLSTYASIVAAFFVGFLASGFAMYAWLKDTAKAPLLGALLFMAAPYHMVDFYSRGNLAEFIGIALIPVVAIGIRRASEGRIVLCALAYAALILSHLPLALLVSLFLIAPYGLYLSRLEPRRLIPIVVPLLLGLAMAAIYLLPAIALDSYRDSAVLWHIEGLRPENWSLFHWGRPNPPPGTKLVFVGVILTLLQPTVVLLFTRQRRWGLYSLLCLAMAAALIPQLWQLPLLQSVQFPFRMLPLAEFAIATGVAHLLLPRLLILAAVFPMLGPTGLALAGQTVGASIPLEKLTQHPDVPENLPPGDRPWTWPSKWALQVALSNPAARQVGDRTVERVFYFPAWEVRCQGAVVPTAPDPETKLLSYRGRNCERRLRLTDPERIGAAVSLAGLLLLIGLAAGRRRARSRPAHVNDADLVRMEAPPLG